MANAPEHVAEAVAALSYIDPTQPYGTELFEQLVHLTVSACYETVLFRRNDYGKIEVFLSERKANEAYAGELHSPGFYLRPGKTVKEALLGDGETPPEKLAGVKQFGAKIIDFCHLGTYLFPERRGTLNGNVVAVTIDGGPDENLGSWYPVDELPEHTIWHHKIFLPKVARVWAGEVLPELFDIEPEPIAL